MVAATPICTVDATGIHKPTLATVLSYFTSGYMAIYGSDVYLGSDSQDGELMGLLGSALDDANAMCVQAYQSYSPATAQGAGLSTVVKINGIARNVSSNSSVPILVVGVATSAIANGLIADAAGHQWLLPASVVIPPEGQITVTATCQTPGAVALSSGATSVNNGGLTILNPTRGWQSVTATANATLGAPVETDPQLRIRQSNSTMIPSTTMLGGIVGALWTIPGVARLRVYQNETESPDDSGIPGYSIAVVMDGGDAQTIAETISHQKFACGTYGTTTETVIDDYGVAHSINFFYVTEPPITWQVSITAGPTFSVNTVALIQASMASYTNAAGIGNGIQLTRAYAAAYLAPSIAAAAQALQDAIAGGDAQTIATATRLFTALNLAAATYEVTALTVARDGAPLAAADVSIAFNEAPYIAVNADGSLVDTDSVVVAIS